MTGQTLFPDDLTNRQIEARDEALERINRLRGMFGAVVYLMTGHDRPLEGEFCDFAVWFQDIRDWLDETSIILNDFPIDAGRKEGAA